MTLKSFKKATKHQLKLRFALAGVSGGGKTYSALRIATALVPGGRIAVIDTERESALLYADEFTFDTLPLESFHPYEYIEAIAAAEAAGYDVIIIDSLSHAWAGKDGVLDEKDRIAKRSHSGNGYAAWSEAGKLQDALIDAITRSSCHVIVTMRSKIEHVQDVDDRGKKVVRKVGMKVIQRDDLEYEFTLFASMTNDNTLIVEKSRCKALNGAIIKRPGQEIAETLRTWLNAGEPTASRELEDGASGHDAETEDGDAGAHAPTSDANVADGDAPRRAVDDATRTVRDIRRWLERAKTEAEVAAAVEHYRDALNTKLDRASRREVRRQISVAQQRVGGRAA